MSNGNWQIVVAHAVRKVLRKIPRKDGQRIEGAIDAMCSDPYQGDVDKLGGENTWRRRVGSYRIKYEVYSHSRIVLIFKVERRTSTTY